jgi:ferredoxin
MIVGDRKPLEEIIESIEDAENVLVAGCGTCVAICMAGGEKEVQMLAQELKMAGKLREKNVQISEATAQRQCDKEYLETIKGDVEGKDIIISMACGIGVQHLAERFAPTRVVPGINTDFLGVNWDIGEWKEYCQNCGDCVLGKTGGICPIARCSKSLLNGPCGGSDSGKCEIDPDTDCAWQLIYDRMNALGRVDLLAQVEPIKSWKTSRDGGPRKLSRNDMKPAEEKA